MSHKLCYLHILLTLLFMISFSYTRCAFLSGRNPIHVNVYSIISLLYHSPFLLCLHLTIHFFFLRFTFDLFQYYEYNYNPANNQSGFAGAPPNMTCMSLPHPNSISLFTRSFTSTSCLSLTYCPYSYQLKNEASRVYYHHRILLAHSHSLAIA